jgi:hypothetical protein
VVLLAISLGLLLLLSLLARRDRHEV